MSGKSPQSWDALIEERIRAAQSEGHFDDLPDFGRPCAAIDEPYEELWWVRRWMQREGLEVLPPSLEIRREVERELARISELRTESAVRRAAEKLNERIRLVSIRCINGPPMTTSQLDVEEVLARWQHARR